MHIEGIAELAARLDKMDKALTAACKEQLMGQATMVKEKIKERAPLGPTGNLKRSCMAKMMPEKMGYPMVAIAGIDRKIAPHAHLVEFGTVRAPAHPFFRPAIEEAMPKASMNIRAALAKTVEAQT